MDYKKLAADLLSGCEENCADCEYAGDSEFECTIAQLAANAITELLARVEAAEARCETLEKMVKEYQDVIVPGYRERAEKAEADRDGRCVVVTRCHECENHREDDGQHYCKFWRMYCPDDSDFYCKAAKPR